MINSTQKYDIEYLLFLSIIARMSEKEVCNIILKAAKMYNVTVRKVCINLDTWTVAVLVKETENLASFRVAFEGGLIGWFDEDFNKIDDVEVQIPDEDCLDIYISFYRRCRF